MSKIELNDTTAEMIGKMSEGNPGAVNVLMRLMEATPTIDPDNFMGKLGNILNLDSFGIYGPSIWVLFKDNCGGDIRKVCLVLRATQLGIFKQRRLQEACIDGPDSRLITEDEFTEMETTIAAKLPNFAKD